MNIVEFAKTLNLSIGTVSRALNDRAEVSPKTRQLVLDKAQELGFSRSATARRLVTGTSSLIVLECPNNTHIMSDRYLVELARAIEEAAGGAGYDLFLHLGTRRDKTVETQAADGLIIVADPNTTTEDLVNLTASGRIPAVAISSTDSIAALPRLSRICLDRSVGLHEAMGKLAELGHRRIGYIGSGHAFGSALPGLLGAAGLEWNADLAIEAGLTQRSGFDAATKLLAASPRPTALFTRTDVLAIGALQAAQQLGLRVPEDLSIIGHDDIELAATSNPPLTTIGIDITAVAAAAVEELLTAMNSDAPARDRILGTRLILRQSLGPARVG